MKKTSKTLAWAMGTTLISGLTSVAVGAEANFQVSELSSGYMQLAQADAVIAPKSSEAKKVTEGKCAEGKCGGTMKPAEPAKTNTDAKATEGKCGEGKCGGDMLKKDGASKSADTKPAQPANTGSAEKK